MNKQYFAKVAVIFMASVAIWFGASVNSSAACIAEAAQGGRLIEEQVRPLYSVDGHVLNEDLQNFLYDCLDAKGCSWWYEYALCQAYQESRFNTGCVNPRNLEDKGLFQYKERYWAATAAQYGYSYPDIFDPYVQIDVYTSQIADRCASRYGDPWYMLSDHYTGGYGYNQGYVNDVTQWLYTMERLN